MTKIGMTTALLAVSAGVTLLWWAQRDIDVTVLPAAAPMAMPAKPVAASVAVSPAPVPAEVQVSTEAVEHTAQENWLPELDAAAIDSLAHSRLHGDARAPALSARTVRTVPTAAELANHDLYLAYEQRQDKQLKRAYVEAAQVKTAELQNWIAKGRQHGISDEQIAQAQRKLDGIQAMAAELQQQHPDLLNDEFQPTDTPWLKDADASTLVEP